MGVQTRKWPCGWILPPTTPVPPAYVSSINWTWATLCSSRKKESRKNREWGQTTETPQCSIALQPAFEDLESSFGWLSTQMPSGSLSISYTWENSLGALQNFWSCNECFFKGWATWLDVQPLWEYRSSLWRCLHFFAMVSTEHDMWLHTWPPPWPTIRFGRWLHDWEWFWQMEICICLSIIGCRHFPSQGPSMFYLQWIILNPGWTPVLPAAHPVWRNLCWTSAVVIRIIHFNMGSSNLSSQPSSPWTSCGDAQTIWQASYVHTCTDTL